MSAFLILTHLALAIGCILAVYMVSRINREQRSPAAAIAWLLVITLLPFVGIPLYLMIGGRKMKQLADRKASLVPDAHENELPIELSVVDRVFRDLGMPGVTTGNRVRLCRTGEDIFAEFVNLIGNANESIHLTTFILGTDEVGAAIVELLARRAGQGVDVRLLLDAVGSRSAGKKFLDPFLRAGGKVAYFMPMLRLPWRAGRTNLRNHRKLMVVDECRVLSGGANIAREYIGPAPLEGRWRDLSFVLEGPGARDYAEVFAADWHFASGENLVLNESPAGSCTYPDPGAIVQVVPSGPDVPGDYLYDAVLSAIFEAQKRLWIATPYFVPDETLSKALQIAAHRGVDVCVVVPEHSNHHLVDIAGRHPLREVVKAGGRVLCFTPGMMHAKVMVVDDLMAVIGSANMDMRSLLLNYEAVMFAYSQPEIQATESWIRNLMAQSRPFDEKISVFSDFGEGVVRMMAPLL